MQAVFLDTHPLDQGDVDFGPLAAVVPDLRLHARTSPDETVKRIRDADIVILNKVVLGEREMGAAAHLRLIVLCATGTDNVDVVAAHRRGIVVCNCRGYATQALVQHAFALILALSTHLTDYDRAVRAGRWQQSHHFGLLDYPIREVSGRTLGILGHGDSGRGVARVAEAIGMRVLVAERPARAQPRPGRVVWPQVLETSDVLSLHCPLTPETRHLIDRAALARMRSDAILINTARGELVDEHALADALRGGTLGGAGLDVLSAEPPRDGNPLLDAGIPNLIVTPHCAWGSHEARQRALQQVTENIRAFLDGNALRQV